MNDLVLFVKQFEIAGVLFFLLFLFFCLIDGALRKK